jgi:hypothetical protein
VPFFPVDEKILNTFYSNNNKDSSDFLQEKGGINFVVKGDPDGNWEAIPAYYKFISKDGTTLGFVPIPLFREAKQ